MDIRRRNMVLVGVIAGLFVLAVGPAVRPSLAQVPNLPSRQVTLFGIVATPHDSTIDPKLRPIETQLRKLLPGHGFTLVGTESKRLLIGDTLRTVLGDTGLTASTQLVAWSDDEGKVVLRFALDSTETTEVATVVRTPANQLFFCDKALPNRMRLLIGIGAR